VSISQAHEDGESFPHERGRSTPLGLADQVQRAELVLRPPATPVRERVEPAEDLVLGRRTGIGHDRLSSVVC
jgi:hypothetical protein